MKADRLLGSSLDDLLPQLGEGLPERVRETKTTDHRDIGVEVRSKLAGRGPMDLALNITPLTMGDRTTRGVAIVLEDLTEKRKLEGQRRLFERMVPPAVINQLDPDSLHLGGRRADITTLFADIRGFSMFSATNNPEVLVRLLNHYLAAAAGAVLREEGTIDKFLGDGLMAWFNAPMPQPDHTLRAVRAALGIRQAVEEVQAKLPRQFYLSFGVGMHYGEAILGLVGTQNRLDYTAIYSGSRSTTLSELPCVFYSGFFMHIFTCRTGFLSFCCCWLYALRQDLCCLFFSWSGKLVCIITRFNTC